MAEETTQTSGSSNSKLYKALCYFSYLWLIPYFVAKGEVRDENMILNLKQGFGCLVLIVIGQLLAKLSVSLGAIVIGVGGILALIGFINVLQGKDKELPLLGSQFTSWFSFVK
jgi:hypothetical protein